MLVEHVMFPEDVLSDDDVRAEVLENFEREVDAFA